MHVHVRDRDPLVDFRGFDRDLDRIVRSAFGFDAPAPAGPAFSVTPDADGVTVRAELPGVDPNALSIAVENRVLTLTAARATEPREPNGYRLRERTYGTFSHALRLSDELDADAVSAECRNGVLSVRIPKRAAIKPRQIEVKVA
jgi:HSP20 family protein